MESKRIVNRQAAEEAAAAWIARRECGAWSAADEAELRVWVEADINHRAAWLRLDFAWRQSERLKELAGVNTPAESRELHHTRFNSNWRGAIAAGVALVAVCTGAFYFLSERPHYRTAVGALQAIPLADGSRVTMNTATDLRITVTRTERRIDLKAGEAYFEVAKDPLRPFIVNAGSTRVTAVGTQFSVRRNAGDLQVIVTEGSVKIEEGFARNAKSMVLTAGNIARATQSALQVERTAIAEAEQALNWRLGYLTFDRTPLAEAAAEFNRYNTRQIVIDDPEVAKVPVGGNFRASNLDAFVRLIQSDMPVVSVEQGERIFLRARTAADR